MDRPHFPDDINKAHRHCSKHRAEVEASDVCGCFHCCRIFPPSEIEIWIDIEKDWIEQCATCPKCGIDSVLGSQSGFPITIEFLEEMKSYWFQSSCCKKR